MPEFLTAGGYLGVRILAGELFFVASALLDLRKHGRAATRWREYAFLHFCVLVACAYGALNDQLSVTLSWEYFYYGKELSKVLGPDTPPAELPLRLHAGLVGVMATWSAGLIIGAALLIANNRRKSGAPQLAYRQLAAQLPVALAITAVLACVGATVGHLGGLTWLDSEFQEMVRQNYWRPYRFMSAWGEHLGAYLGGLAGLALAVHRVLALRRRT